jgi:nucleoside-diphosphate-sugar epimerase
VDEQRIRPDKSEVFRLWCDNTKIEKMTGYKPKTNIRQGLEKTIDWLLVPENLNCYKSEIYNV